MATKLGTRDPTLSDIQGFAGRKARIAVERCLSGNQEVNKHVMAVMGLMVKGRSPANAFDYLSRTLGRYKDKPEVMQSFLTSFMVALDTSGPGEISRNQTSRVIEMAGLLGQEVVTKAINAYSGDREKQRIVAVNLAFAAYEYTGALTENIDIQLLPQKLRMQMGSGITSFQYRSFNKFAEALQKEGVRPLVNMSMKGYEDMPFRIADAAGGIGITLGSPNFLEEIMPYLNRYASMPFVAGFIVAEVREFVQGPMIEAIRQAAAEMTRGNTGVVAATVIKKMSSEPVLGAVLSYSDTPNVAITVADVLLHSMIYGGPPTDKIVELVNHESVSKALKTFEFDPNVAQHGIESETFKVFVANVLSGGMEKQHMAALRSLSKTIDFYKDIPQSNVAFSFYHLRSIGSRTFIGEKEIDKTYELCREGYVKDVLEKIKDDPVAVFLTTLYIMQMASDAASGKHSVNEFKEGVMKLANASTDEIARAAEDYFQGGLKERLRDQS
jgi:hypothetical protein